MKLFSKKKVMKFELDVIEEDLILTLKSQLAQVSTAYQVEDAFNTLQNKYGIDNIIYSSKKTKQISRDLLTQLYTLYKRRK